MTTNATPHQATAESIAAITKRADELRERRTRVLALVEAEERRAEEARTQAQQQFGTSDLEALRQLYAKQLAEFNQAWFDFELELDQVEAVLARAEAQLRSV